MEVPALDLKLVEDKQPQDDIIIEREWDHHGARIYPRWLPQDYFGPHEVPGDLWLVFDAWYMSYATADKFSIADVEEISRNRVAPDAPRPEWVRQALFTQEEYNDAAYLEDFTDLAFLYYLPAASSGKVRHRWPGASEHYGHWFKFYSEAYLELNRRFLPWLRDKDLFGTALIVPFDIAI